MHLIEPLNITYFHNPVILFSAKFNHVDSHKETFNNLKLFDNYTRHNFIIWVCGECSKEKWSILYCTFFEDSVHTIGTPNKCKYYKWNVQMF